MYTFARYYVYLCKEQQYIIKKILWSYICKYEKYGIMKWLEVRGAMHPFPISCGGLEGPLCSSGAISHYEPVKDCRVNSLST